MAAAEECDLVMKGGITSGIVYQGAVLALKERYRFRNVGGASAGAIAAAVTAAAQYGELANPGRGGFARMDEVTEYLREPGAVARLFPAAPGAQQVLDILIGFVTGQRPVRARALAALSEALARSGWGLLIAVVAITWGVLLTLVDRDLGFWAMLAATPLVLGFAVAAAAVGALAWILRTITRTTRAHGFGLCPGVALTEWLHERIQHCAGTNELVTFELLETHGVRFQTVSTDLTSARPVILPLDEGRYAFDPEDLRARFPEEIVRHLLANSEATFFPAPDGTPLRTMPTAKLPILVAARMSLSFPLLLSAVRLYTLADEPLEPVPCWFTDGGAASNFPIHFFDSWFPSRPTFGLDLQGHRAGEPFTHMPAGPDEPVRPRWREFAGLGGFLAALVDAARNWRDTMQSELPGYRDRVCHIRLGETEGGLNLNMPPDVIESLIERGGAAGHEVLARFDWPRHRLTRYRTLVGALDSNLRATSVPFAEWRPGPGLEDSVRKTEELLAWRLDLGPVPQPEPVMRIAPRV